MSGLLTSCRFRLASIAIFPDVDADFYQPVRCDRQERAGQRNNQHLKRQNRTQIRS
jgi:hypothetical protein